MKRLSPRAWRKRKLEVFERDKGICQWCRKPVLEWQEWDADHITKRSKGGSDDMDNLRLIHRYPCHVQRHPEFHVQWTRKVTA